MRLSLIVRTQGKMKGKAIPVPRLPFLIGRARNCQLRPASPMVSKLHCGFALEGKSIFLNDFKSTNGTFLNDKQVDGRAEVHDGDILRLGSLEFELRVQGVPAVDEPTPLPPHRGRPAKANEEDIAALLLASDGEASSSSSTEVTETRVQTTSLTSADTQISTLPPDPLPEPVATMNGEENALADGDKKKESKSEPEKPKYGNTSEAAENILKMYLRRNRGQRE